MPRPPSKRFVCTARGTLLGVVVVGLLQSRAAAEPETDRVLVSASVGIGVGTKRFAPVSALAKLDAHVWLYRGFGVAMTATGHATGAFGDDLHDGGSRSSSGSLIAAGISTRFPVAFWPESNDPRPFEPDANHACFSILVGRDRHRGFDADNRQSPFDDTELGWMAKASMHTRFGSFVITGDLIGYGVIGHGASVLVALGGGFAR